MKFGLHLLGAELEFSRWCLNYVDSGHPTLIFPFIVLIIFLLFSYIFSNFVFSVLVLMVLAAACPHLPHQDPNSALNLTASLCQSEALYPASLSSLASCGRCFLVGVLNCFKCALPYLSETSMSTVCSEFSSS